MTTITEQAERAAAAADFGQPGALKRGRDQRWPYVPVIIWPERVHGAQQQIKGLAFASRDEALAYAQHAIDAQRDLLRRTLTSPRHRALRVQYGLPAELS